LQLTESSSLRRSHTLEEPLVDSPPPAPVAKLAPPELAPEVHTPLLHDTLTWITVKKTQQRY
jgi:hypothetical protein